MNNTLQKKKWGFARLLTSVSLMLLISLIFLSTITISAQSSAVNLDGNGNPAAYNYNVDYISVPSDPSLNLNGNFTIEMWFKMETTGGWPNPSEAFYQPDWHTLISKGYWGNANEFCVLVTSNTLYAAVNGQAYLAPANIQTNQWYHMALTRNNGLLQFYLNGNLLTGGSGTQNNSSNINNTKELRIGKNYGTSRLAYSDSHAYGFDGSIDEVRIWNVARTQSEIANNMNHNSLCGTTGLVAYFPFDENAGTTTTSTIGNYVGTLVGGATWAAGVSTSPCAPTQTLTILGGFGTRGQIDPYTEASRDGGVTWQPAYLTGGGHPWGEVVGTNSWVNFAPSFFVGLYTTTDYRIRFNIPSDFSNPKMTFTVKADNYAWLSLNGTNLAYIVGQASNAPDLSIAQNLQSGLNEITIRLKDEGGWVGLNYRIDITMQSNEIPVLVPAPPPNRVPVANAGPDQTINCAPAAGVSVTLNGSGSSDPDGDALAYSWSNGATTASQTLILAPGTHTFTLTVSDGKGGTATDNVTVIINADVTAPVPDMAELPEITGECSATILSAPKATDACTGSVTGTTSNPMTYTSPGTFTITWTYKDGNGNSSQQTQKVIVKDITPPVVTGATGLLTLWPPDHKYETIKLSGLGITVTDNCSAVSASSVIITKVTSDEVEDSQGNGDGNTLNDIVISNDFKSVDLRKEREGNGNGRVYTIFLAVGDGHGNIGSATVKVQVPHDKKDTAVDDGPAYVVTGGTIAPVSTSIANAASDEPESAGYNSVSNSFDNQSAPEGFELKQNYPNPFNPTTTISVAIPEAGYYTVKVFNTLGQEVAELVNGQLGRGNYSFRFDASKLSTGIYIYNVRGNNVNISRKMSLMK